MGWIRLDKSDGPLLGSLNYRKEILAQGTSAADPPQALDHVEGVRVEP